MWSTTLTTILLLSSSLLSTATPIQFSALFKRDCNTTITEAQMIAIAPTSKNCSNPPAEGECATAKQAAKYTALSFDTYNISSKAEQAAIIGLMAFESEDFKYNKNHFPGVPGQGSTYTYAYLKKPLMERIGILELMTDIHTARNMQSPSYNKKYASSIPALKDQIAKVSNSTELLDLLRENETYDFGSGAWFLTTQCSDAVRSALRGGTETGWQGYIADCVGTAANDERKEYWVRAVKALGVTGS